ncbi:MAG: SET domain-containing protein-lysine N-methyltransferase [Myxococcaceae bacterium]
MVENIIVKKSSIQGTGVFATANFKKGEIVCKMRGEKICFQELKRRYADGKEKICNPLQNSEKEYFDLAEPYVYFNHSCTPNCGIRKKGELFALKNIPKNTELTYDYSTTEWTYEKFGKYKDWAMECNCGSEQCRGTLGQFPTLDSKLKKKYFVLGALQDFILRKLEKKMFA